MPPSAIARQLDLGFTRSNAGRTELSRRRAAYPWSVTQPFYDDVTIPGLATLIPQSSSGGLFSGDRLRQRICTARGASAVVYTQGATVAHRAQPGEEARSHWELIAGRSSRMEFVNDPLVLSAGAAVHQTWMLSAHHSARLVLVDGWTWLRGGDAHGSASFLNEIVVRAEDGATLANERSHVTPGTLERLAGFGDHPPTAFGCAIVIGKGATADYNALRERLVQALGNARGCWSGVALLPNGCGLVARAASMEAGELLAWSESAWRTVREVDGHGPPAPRRRGV